MMVNREGSEDELATIFLVQVEHSGYVSEVGPFHHSVFHRIANRLLLRFVHFRWLVPDLVVSVQ